MAEELIYSTRRDFIRGALGTLSLSATMPAFLCRTAWGFDRDEADQRILVVLQLAGGNDGLNTIVPYEEDAYYRARPQIGVPASECLKLEHRVGLNPALSSFKKLFDEGQLAILQGVGYPNPNRSHFRSMDIWHSGDISGRGHSGWLGRYFDHCCEGNDPPQSRDGVALMAESPLALAGDQFTPLAFDSPEKLALRLPRNVDPKLRDMFERLNRGPRPESQTSDGQGRRRRKPKDDNPALSFLQRSALEARMGGEAVRKAAREMSVDGRPGSLKHQLSLVSEMISADFPTRVYYLSFGGFDTHANQGGRHRNLLTQLGGALQTFQARLRRDKLEDRVMVVTFSEFGRRVKENASGGTDHGAAAPMFLFGSKVKPGVHFDHPSLQSLDNGDLIHGCDFRRVYATILDRWLKVDARQVLGADHRRVDVIS
jgi:uncharacterized protein (DUF1501 family)